MLWWSLLALVWGSGLALDADYLDTILSAPVVEMIVTTSWSMYADSGDAIEVTFHGQLSTSGPHNLGPFITRGETVKQNVTLDRFIGPLDHITLQNRGHNGWLPSRVNCVYNDYLFTFGFPKTWLNSFDYDAFLEEGNGYEPRVQQHEDEINSAEFIRLDISNSVKLNVLTGNKPLDYTLSVDGY
jgi:hypothetical protein